MMSEEGVLPSLASEPALRLHLDDVTHPATSSFVTLIDCTRLLPNAIQHVIKHLYTPYGIEHIPPVRSVTIVLRKMGGVAYTTGIRIDDMHKEMHVSLDYLGGRCKEPLLFRDEAIGVITHEMVHCFQNTCHGTAPGGLIEGIADYVRLKSGLAPPHWKRTKDEIGKKWDEGYQRTAWFLEWLEDHRGDGTISRMNETMGQCKYKEEEFWPELFGETVDILWKRYVKEWEEKSRDSETQSQPESSDGTEPEIVALTDEEKVEAQNVMRAEEFHA